MDVDAAEAKWLTSQQRSTAALLLNDLLIGPMMGQHPQKDQTQRLDDDLTPLVKLIWSELEISTCGRRNAMTPESCRFVALIWVHCVLGPALACFRYAARTLH